MNHFLLPTGYTLCGKTTRTLKDGEYMTSSEFSVTCSTCVARMAHA